MTSNFGIWFLVALSLTCSFLLSGMEAGVLALNRLRIRQRARSGDASARVLHGFLEKPENFLWTIVVGNTLANCLAISLLVSVLDGWLGAQPWLFAGVIALLVFLLYALADLLPKMLFRQFPNRLCMRLAGPFRLLHLALSPLVGVTAWLAGLLLRWTGGGRFLGHLFGNREELRLVMQESGQALTSEERAIIGRVLDLQTLTVGDLTVPMEKVRTVTVATPLSQVLEVCRESGLNRLPVREKEGGRVAGVFSLMGSLYRPEAELGRNAGDHLQSALYLEDSSRLEVALQKMQRTTQRLAIVLGPDRGEIGIVTLEDILKFVFGEVSL